MKTIQPSNVYAGLGSVDNLKNIIERENFKNILIFSDKSIIENGLVKPIEALLDDMNCSYRIVDELKPEPSYLEVQKVVDSVNEIQADVIIAIGGGSVMDSAKLCSLLIKTDLLVKDLLKNPSIAKKELSTIMIPTTCGTGAEATPNAIVLVPEENLKVGIVNEEMIPDFVILDAEFIRKLPAKILAATGVDALSHVVECYTSNKANTLSDTYALRGAQLIFENLINAYQFPEDMEAKQNMMIAAYYGGVAITGSGTTAVHALSYPLGGKFHIPHGVSNAILFGHVMQYNKDSIILRLEEIYDYIFHAITTERVVDKAQYVINEIFNIIEKLKIPTDVFGFGVKNSDLDFLVDSAYEVKRLLNNNKKVLGKDDIRKIYQKVM